MCDPPDNPYRSPWGSPNGLERGSSPVTGVIRAAPWVFVALLIACSLYHVYCNHWLRSQYPNLEDHSPGVDWYWPHVANLINNIVAAASALLAIFVAWVTVAIRKKNASEEPQLKTTPEQE